MKRKVYQELIDVINAVLAGRDAEPMEDWEAINELAKRHRLCGFVYEAVKFRKDLPEETLRRIRNHFFMAAGQQSRQEHYATELSNALRAKGIPYAPLKGICLRRHYPKPTLRMSGDVNFLVSPEHREEVASILLGYGFRRDEQTPHSDHYILDHVEMRIHTNLRVRDEGMQDYFANPRERMQSEDGLQCGGKNAREMHESPGFRFAFGVVSSVAGGAAADDAKGALRFFALLKFRVIIMIQVNTSCVSLPTCKILGIAVHFNNSIKKGIILCYSVNLHLRAVNVEKRYDE
jgi:hypothetical protein